MVINGAVKDQTFSTCSENKGEARMRTERRTLARLNLRLPVLLFRTGLKEPIRTETTDFSTGGFYCTTQEPFGPGDKFNCLIALPSHDRDSVQEGLLLKCAVEVVRVVARAEIPGFGIGCRISEYHVVPEQAVQRRSKQRGSQATTNGKTSNGKTS